MHVKTRAIRSITTGVPRVIYSTTEVGQIWLEYISAKLLPTSIIIYVSRSIEGER